MSAVPADLRTRSPWRTALPAFVALVAIILILYRDTALTMASIWWRSETFAHAMLVPPITLWLVWRQRARLAPLTPRAQPWMLLPLLATALVWLLSKLIVADVVGQFALVATLVLAVPAVLGLEVTMVILFPLLFLFFAVPFGEFVVPMMMRMTAHFTVLALQMTGVPVFQEGQHFTIPTGSWSVIDECSGVRYLMASFMVGALFAYLNYRSYKRRAVFMLAALLMPIVANWLRAYIIVMLAYLSGNKIATGIDHIIYGWVFFGLIVFVLFLVGARWAEPDTAPAASAAAGLSRRPGAPPASVRPTLVTLLAGLVVALLPHLALSAFERTEGAAAEPQLELPAQLAKGWFADGARLVNWTPEFLNPSVDATRRYAGPAGTVGVYLAYYRHQGEGHKLVSGNNVFIGMRDDHWNQVLGADREVSAGRHNLTVHTAELIGRQPPDGQRRPHLLVWRFYWIDGRFIASDVMAKLYGGLARLEGRGDEGAAIVLYADEDSVAASDATLSAFIKANLDALDALLQRTRDAR